MQTFSYNKSASIISYYAQRPQRVLCWVTGFAESESCDKFQR